MSENENQEGTTPEEDNFGADQPELPKLDELEVLKQRATQMGITFHPNIGLETLRERINAQLETQAEPDDIDTLLKQRAELDAKIAAAGGVLAETVAAPATPAPAVQQPIVTPITKPETTAEKNARMRKDAAKLVRCRITCMNPAKTEYEGEIFTVSNSIVGTFRKYVPYNADEGWHIPKIIFDHLQEKQCQVFHTVKDDRGRKVRKGKLIREFAIEVLPPLTKEELEDLAQRQAMAGNIG